MTGYFVSAAIGKLEVFDLMVVTREPVVNGNGVTAADRYGQAVACFAQQHVGSRNTFAELQGIVTAFVLDGVATVTFIEEVGIVAGTGRSGHRCRCRRRGSRYRLYQPGSHRLPSRTGGCCRSCR